MSKVSLVLLAGLFGLGVQEPPEGRRADGLRAWAEARLGVEVRWSREGVAQKAEAAEGEPPAWVEDIKASGAKYVILSVPEETMEEEPAAALARVCRESGLRVGISLRRGEGSAARRDPGTLLGRVQALWGGCGPLDHVRFEGSSEGLEPEAIERLFAAARAAHPGALLADAWGKSGDLALRAPSGRRPWESYVPLAGNAPGAPRAARECIQALVRAAAAGGNVLLGVELGPRGKLDPVQSERLRSVGGWLRKYGESVYVTRGGPFPPESWGGATCEGETVYLHVLEWPAEVLYLPGLDRRVLSAEVLTGGTAEVRQHSDELEVRVSSVHRREPDTIVVLTLDGPAETARVLRPVPVSQGKRATASSVRGGDPASGPERALDGDENTGWIPEPSPLEAWIEIDLGAEERVGRVCVRTAAEGGGGKFEIRSAEGETWRTVVSGSSLRLARDLRFLPVRTRRIRLVLIDPPEGTELREVQFFRSREP